MRRRDFVTLLGGAAAWPLAARAQDEAAGYPARPITLIVPYAPGGGNDVLARAVAEPMGKTLGQPVVVENHGGAGGSIGTRQVAKAAPDGYTLGLGGTGTLAIDPTLYPNAGYDPRKDFAPVGLIATSPLIVLVNPSVPAHTIQELIALAKKQKLTYASAGRGSGIHLGTVLFAQMAGIELTHVPYRGSAPALTDLLGGHVQIYFSSLPPAIGLVKDGRLRALGVTGLIRSASFPDVPTVAEQGLPGFEAVLHYGIVAPAGTPRAIVGKLNAALRLALADARGQQTHRDRRRRAAADHGGRIRRRHRPRGNEVVGAGEKVGRAAEVGRASARDRLKPMDLEQRRGGRRRQSLDQRGGGGAIAGRGADARRKDRGELQCVRKRPGKIHTFDRQQLGDLLHRQFGLAARHHFGDAPARPEHDLAAQDVRDAQPLQQLLEIDAAGAFARAHHRACRQQRALERVRGGDIGLGRARAHRDAEAAARNVAAGFAQNQALPGQFVDHRTGDDRHVEGRAVLDGALERIGGIVTNGQPLPARVRKLRRQRAQHRFHGMRAEDFELGHSAILRNTRSR